MAVVSRLIIGGSGSGKSEQTKTELVEIAKQGKTAIVLMDPHGKLARDFLIQLINEGLDHRVLYDQFSNFDRVLGGLSLVRSTDPNPFRRESQDQRQIMSFMNNAWRAAMRGDKLFDHPSTVTGMDFVTRIMLFQPEPVPLKIMPYLFRPKHPICKALVDSCTDEEAAEFWENVMLLLQRNNHNALNSEIGGAQRLIRTLFNFPAFRERCTGDFKIGEAIKNRQIIIFDGSDDGSVPKEVTTALYGCRSLQIYNFMQAHHAQTDTQLPTVQVWDEAPAINAISAYEIDMLRELRKTGWAGWVVGQDLGFLDLQIKQTVKSCTPEHVWYNPGDEELAIEAAKDLATAKLDPLKVKFIHETERQVFDGYVPKIKKGTSKSEDRTTESESEYEQAKYRSVVDQRPEFIALNDQILLDAQKLMQMTPGYRMRRTREYVSEHPEYYPMLKNPWPEEFFPGCARIKLFKAIAKSQARPEFISPVLSEASWEPTLSNSHRNEIKEPSTGSTSTPVPPASSTSQGNTQPKRKRGKGSNGTKS